MPRQKEEMLTITEAARELGVSRANLYARIKRSRDRGETTPFTTSEELGGILVAPKKAVLKWARAAQKPSAARRIRKNRILKPPTTPATLPTPSSAPVAVREDAGPLAATKEKAAIQPVEPLLPRPTKGAPLMDVLPPSYMEDRLLILPRDPSTFVVYWDVNPETAARHGNSRWALKVMSDVGERVIEVGGGAKNWYIRGLEYSQILEVLFGPLDEWGNLHPVARSVWGSQPSPRYDPTDDSEGIAWGKGVPEFAGTRLETVAAPPSTMEPDVSVVLRGSGRGRQGIAPSSPGISSWHVSSWSVSS